jgi:hypothetical protein
MDSLELMHGTAPSECVQYIMGHAFREHTPEAMRIAAHKLEGIATLLTFMRHDLEHGSDFGIRISNEIVRCYHAADLIERNEL